MANESEDYIYSESPEIAVGEDTRWFHKLLSAFPALQSKNYQLYFSGQLVSLVGTWLQIVAEGWLVLSLTNSAFWVGTVTALATIPSLFLSLFGGVIVDRVSKRTILLYTQSAAMTLAIVYGLLTTFHLINLTEICILAFLLGVVNAIDLPARQAFVVELVNKEQLASAIALNSGMFNAARVIGPSVAGLLIAVIGTGGAFILNGISYIAGIVGVYYISVRVPVVSKHLNPLKAIKEGIVFSFSHPIIQNLFIFVGIVSIFGWSYSTLMPVIAKNVYHIGVSGLGYLYAATGLGALSATIVISAFSQKISRIVFIIGGNTLFAVSLILFTLIHSTAFACILLFLAGLGLLSQFATINTTIQHMVSDSMRGRVMSIYTVMFLGLSPLGNFEIGVLAEHIGPSHAIQIGAVIVLLFGIYLFFRRNNIRSAHVAYDAATS